MTFDTQEFSTADGQPIEVYRFRTSSGLDFRFTNAETEVTDDDALVYTPTAIVRTQPQQSTERRATELRVTISYLDDTTDDFGQLFIAQPPEGLTTLVIKRTHLTDVGQEFVTFWEGSVISAAYNEDGEVEVLCKGFKNIFEREGPRMTWGGPCQHTLYDENCGLLAVNFTTSNVTVAALASDGVTITLGNGVPSPIPDFVGGKVSKDNGLDFRFVVAQNGPILTIQQPFRADFAVGDLVDIEQGCNHQLTGDCLNKFNNAVNYGGAAFTPGLNPFADGLDKL